MEENSPTKAKKTKKKSKTNWPMTIGITLILIAVVAAVCFFLQGETKVTGEFPEPETSESLVCEVEGLGYPFFKYDKSTKKTTKVNAVFSGDKLKTISLVYRLYYNSSEEIKQSEAENHAAMNLKMQDEGLGPDALGMNYAKLTDSLKMSLYAEGSEINGATAKYFELDGVSNYNKANLQAAYEQKGFGCVANEK